MLIQTRGRGSASMRPVHPGLGADPRSVKKACATQTRCHRAHSHHLQHHWGGRIDRTLFRQPVGQVQPSGEFTVINGGLVRDRVIVDRRDDHNPKHLKGFWLHPIDRVPAEIIRRCIPMGVSKSKPKWFGVLLRADKVDRSGAELRTSTHGWRFARKKPRRLTNWHGARPQDHAYHLRTQSATHVEMEHREHMSAFNAGRRARRRIGPPRRPQPRWPVQRLSAPCPPPDVKHSH